MPGRRPSVRLDDTAPPASPNGLTALRQAEQAVEELGRTRGQFHELGRRAFGIGAATSTTPAMPLADIVGPVAAAVLVLFLPMSLVYLRVDIATQLGVGPLALAALLILVPLATAAAVVPAALLLGGGRRADTVVGTTVVLSMAMALAALAPGQLALAAALAAAGVALAAVDAVHRPLLADLTEPAARPRALAAHRGAQLFGGAMAVELVAVLTAVSDATWRAGVLLLATVAMGFACAAAARGREARPGLTDAAVLSSAVDAAGPALVDAPSVRPGEALRRVLQVPSFRSFVAAHAAMGLLLLPVPLYLLYWFDDEWQVSPAGRGDLLAVILLSGAVGSIAAHWLDRRLTRRLEAGAASTTRALAVLLLAAAAAFVLAPMVPYLVGAVGLLCVAYAAVGAVLPMVDCLALSVVEPDRRNEAGALLGLATALGMAFGGIALLASMDSRFGPGGAIATAGLVLASAAATLKRSGSTTDDDLDRLVDLVVDRAEVRSLVRRNRHLPMLSCRGIDFSYGQLQVLFDVDLTVDEGEMVALLGTNGAGKSTLLRAISGLGLPRRGVVRFCGDDITHVDAERRVRLGISQIPGGKGLYAPLSVVENLRVFGYSRGGDRQALDERIDTVFEVFPRLGERRNQPAATMSGGEQQMLNLARAFVLRPRLLLIDELSLGLAPIVVGELLESVRRINRDGTAVLIVEQSVNLALSLVGHAYFMEKGQVRFDGPAPDLLERRDLLRSVFLEGAGAGGRS